MTMLPGTPFTVRHSNIEFLNHPSHFRDTLFKLISQAEKRVSLSSLYIGADQAELLDVIKERCDYHTAKKGKSREASGFKVSVILDRYRATRPETYDHDNVRSTVDSFVEKLKDYLPLASSKVLDSTVVEFKLFNIPHRYSWLFRFCSPKLAEICGVFHWKLYIIDSNVILTGANLAQEYFTSRTDRWILIKDVPEMAEYLSRIVDILAKYSSTVSVVDGKTDIYGIPKYKISKKLSKGYLLKQFGAELLDRLNDDRYATSTSLDPATSTIRFGFIGGFLSPRVDDEMIYVQHLLPEDATGLSVSLSSPYMNLRKDLVKIIVDRLKKGCINHLDLITASPMCMSFHRGPMLIGWIPYMYQMIALHCARVFNKALRSNHQTSTTNKQNNLNQVNLREYTLSDTTFHAKGLWVTDHAARTCKCLLGSSNFSTRSRNRDFELIALLDCSTNRELSEKVGMELQKLTTSVRKVVPEASLVRQIQQLFMRFLVSHNYFLKKFL